MSDTPRVPDPTLTAAIVELSADAILTVGPDERILSWNRGAQLMFGWSTDEIIGRHFSVLIPDDELARGELEWIHRTTREKGFIRDHETRRKTKDLRILPVSLTRTAVFDERGNLLGFSAILRDISERKRMEQKLLASERLAVAGTVAAGVAHEIGAPLTAITVAVDHMLRGRCAQCQGANDLQVLRTQIERIARLARQLVNLAKPPSLTFSTVRLDATIEQTTRLLGPQLGRAAVRLEVEVDPDTPAVWADEAQLQQVLINLIVDARQAITGGPGTIWVRARREGPESTELVVEDDGPGVEPSDLPNLFRPFFSRSGGTGLGLAVTAQIVEAHGGTITAARSVRGGACFTVRLPAPAA